MMKLQRLRIELGSSARIYNELPSRQPSFKLVHMTIMKVYIFEIVQFYAQHLRSISKDRHFVWTTPKSSFEAN